MAENPFRQAVEKATGALIHPQATKDQMISSTGANDFDQVTLSQNIIEAWRKECPALQFNNGVLSSECTAKSAGNGLTLTCSDGSWTHQKDIGDTTRIVDTLDNSDQAVSIYPKLKSDGKPHNPLATTYIAGRFEDGQIVTDKVNMTWDPGATLPRIESVEENKNGVTIKVKAPEQSVKHPTNESGTLRPSS